MITKRLLPAGLNHGSGRGGVAPDMLVIHVTEGNAASVRSWFANPVARVSAHYMVCLDGTIDQFVDEDDTAWHAGRVKGETAPLVVQRPNVNPNAYSIGIEHEGTGNQPLMPAQRVASVELIRDICRRRNIPIDRTHIVGHHEVFSEKTCPGAIDVNALVLLAAGVGTLERPAGPLVVWSGFLHDWLIVTRVVSDREWYFCKLSDVGRLAATRSRQSLAGMPRSLTL